MREEVWRTFVLTIHTTRWKYLFLVSDNKNGNYEYNFVEDRDGDNNNNNFVFQFFPPLPLFFRDRISSRRGKKGVCERIERNEMKFHSFIHSSFIHIEFSKGRKEICKNIYIYKYLQSKCKSLNWDVPFLSLSLSLSMQHRFEPNVY